MEADPFDLWVERNLQFGLNYCEACQAENESAKRIPPCVESGLCPITNDKPLSLSGLNAVAWWLWLDTLALSSRDGSGLSTVSALETVLRLYHIEDGYEPNEVWQLVQTIKRLTVKLRNEEVLKMRQPIDG